MKQKQLNNQVHYINLLYICKQQMTSGTGNRNNIEIFLYSWRVLLEMRSAKHRAYSGLTCNDLCKFKCYRSIPHFLPRYFCSRAFQSCIFQPCISSPVLSTFAFWTVLRFYSLISVSRQHVTSIE